MTHSQIKMFYVCFVIFVITLGNTMDQYLTKDLDEVKYLVTSPGCKIPTIQMNYTKIKTQRNVCSERQIHVKKLQGNEVKFHMSKKLFEFCGYRFIWPSLSSSWNIDINVIYTDWLPFTNGTKIVLRSDFIEVQCLSPFNRSVVLYEDVYGKIKKANKTLRSNGKTWNVLLVGIDNMSRNRALFELPKTVEYFKKSKWLDFKAYNKIGDSTFPNLMAVLTNKKPVFLVNECKPDMLTCNDAIIWTRFKKAGYVTAFGEDWSEAYYSHSGPNIMRFRRPPTDHYLRTLFLSRERKIGSTVCLRAMLSVRHVFSYAFEFANTYKYDKYFGYFWISTISHDPNHSPSTFDAALKGFFDRLDQSGVLRNTFVVLFSDHGIRYGRSRRALESYYETRLPMFFMKVPTRFQTQYPEKYANINLQQNGLVVPFDLHLTLWDIASNFEPTNPAPFHDGCEHCTSLFNKIGLDRTCEDASVPDSWCACRALKTVSIDRDYSAYHSLTLVMLRLHNITENIKTKHFTRCHDLSLSKLLRVHTFSEDYRIFYVIAGTLAPDETGFEATVSKDTMLRQANGTYRYKIESLEIITSYERSVDCVLQRIDKTWCVCKDTLQDYPIPARKEVKSIMFEKFYKVFKNK